MDRNLSAVWDDRRERFAIVRRDPVEPHRKPYLVTLVQKNGEFLPLDDRVLDWLAEADCQRQFHGRDERYFAELFDRELRGREEEDQRRREKPIDDKFEALSDGLAWLVKKDPHHVWRHELETMNPLK